jgi:hypothetical protein
MGEQRHAGCTKLPDECGERLPGCAGIYSNATNSVPAQLTALTVRETVASQQMATAHKWEVGGDSALGPPWLLEHPYWSGAWHQHLWDALRAHKGSPGGCQRTWPRRLRASENPASQMPCAKKTSVLSGSFALPRDPNSWATLPCSQAG